MSLTLRPLSEAEFDAWQERSLKEYIADHVAAGTWSEDEARDRAREQEKEILPAGFQTERMLFCGGLAEDGDVVGRVWVALDHPRGVPDCGWIYDIEIVEGRRGSGYGRALLAATEQLVVANGVHSLMLNVFGSNETACKLYGTAGYEVVNQQMRKSLA